MADQKLGVREATIDSPFINSLLSNERLYSKDYFASPPLNLKITGGIDAPLIDLKKKLIERFGDPTPKSLITDLISFDHNTKFLSGNIPKTVGNNSVDKYIQILQEKSCTKEIQ